jgi:hypothetical protein
MGRIILIVVVILLVAPSGVLASEGFSISLGTEYLPLSKVEYGNPTVNSYEIYDNMSVESGLYYNFDL